MYKKNILVICTLAISISVFFSFGVGSNLNYSWISDMVTEELQLADSSTTVAAYVNESPIYIAEIERCVLNLKVLNEVEMKKIEMKFADGLIKKSELDSLIENFNAIIQTTDLFEHVTRTIINDEIYYQAALKLGYKPNVEESFAFEKQTYNESSTIHQEILNAVAKGYALSYSEYAEKFLVPVRIKKLGKVYLDNYLQAVLRSKEENKDLSSEELRILPEYRDKLHYYLNDVIVKLNDIR